MLQQRILDYEHLELKSFDYTEHNAQDLEDEIDPDNRFFSSININCNYFEDDYNMKMIITTVSTQKGNCQSYTSTAESRIQTSMQSKIIYNSLYIHSAL